jgi:hypothetical protein
MIILLFHGEISMSESERVRTGRSTILLLLLVILTGASVLIINYNLKNRKMDLEKSLEYLKSDYTFAEIGVMSGSAGIITFNLKILNVDGSVITDRIYKLNGNDIFIESKVVMINSGKTNRALVFPFNLYTDVIPPRQGELLSGLYAVNGFPAIYLINKPDRSYDDAIRYLYKIAFSRGDSNSGMENEPGVRIMDASLHEGKFRHFEEGQVYRCLVHPDGGLELAEVK